MTNDHERDVQGTGRLLVELVRSGMTEAEVFARGQELLDIDDAAETALLEPPTVLPVQNRALMARAGFILTAIMLKLDPLRWQGDDVLP